MQPKDSCREQIAQCLSRVRAQLDSLIALNQQQIQAPDPLATERQWRDQIDASRAAQHRNEALQTAWHLLQQEQTRLHASFLEPKPGDVRVDQDAARQD